MGLMVEKLVLEGFEFRGQSGYGGGGLFDMVESGLEELLMSWEGLKEAI